MARATVKFRCSGRRRCAALELGFQAFDGAGRFVEAQEAQVIDLEKPAEPGAQGLVRVRAPQHGRQAGDERVPEAGSRSWAARRRVYPARCS